MILLLDNFDSFTYNLLDYFKQLGISCKVLRNNVTLDEIAETDFQAIVFSPGPGVPSQAGIMPDLIKYYHSKLPLLGICLGHQGIGEFFGATLKKAPFPVHGKVSEIFTTPDPIFNTIPSHINVVRYHSLLLENLPEELVVIAQTSDNQVMAIKHKEYPSYGIQFHPEAYLTEYGLTMLRNWANLYQLIG